MLAYKF